MNVYYSDVWDLSFLSDQYCKVYIDTELLPGFVKNVNVVVIAVVIWELKQGKYCMQKQNF